MTGVTRMTMMIGIEGADVGGLMVRGEGSLGPGLKYYCVVVLVRSTNVVCSCVQQASASTEWSVRKIKSEDHIDP